MEPWLFSIGKTKVACGLQWLALNDEDSGDPIANLKVEAKRTGRRFAAYYPNDGGKYRLAAFTGEGKTRQFDGAVPVASWLADVVDLPTIYIESLDETATRWWIIAVKPGSINVNTDSIFTDDAAIQLIDGFLFDNTGGGVAVIVGRGKLAPTSAMIDRIDKSYRSIQDVLAGTEPSPNRIKQVIGVPRIVYAGIAGVFVMAGVAAGGYFLLNHTKALQTQAARDAEAAARAAEETRIAKIAEQRISSALALAIAEDTSIPGMPETVSHCYKALRTIPRTLGGWSATSVVCDPLSAHLKVLYARNIAARGGMSTQLGFELAAAARGGKIEPMAAMADNATVTFDKVLLDRRPPMPITSLPQFNTIASEITSTIQILQSTISGINIQFAQPAPRTILYVDPTRDETAAPTQAVPADRGFKKGTITIEGTDLWRLNAAVIDRANMTSGPITFNFSGASVQWTATVTYLIKA